MNTALKSPLIGAAVIAAATALGALSITAGLGVWSLILVVLVGLAMLLTAEDGFAVAMTGVVIAVGCGLVATDQGAPPFGRTVSGITVSQAPNTPGAYYRFTDGMVIPYHSGDVLIYGRAGRRSILSSALRVAPLVGTDWSPRGRPVPAWVLLPGHDRPGVLPNWAMDHRAAVRVNSIEDEAIRQGIRRAETAFGMTSFVGAPVLRWVADPAAAQAEEWRRLAAIAVIGWGAWALVVAVGRIAGVLRPWLAGGRTARTPGD